MKCGILILAALLAQSSDGYAQLPSRRGSGEMLFGSLLTDAHLQEELKLSESQVRRMQELYLQSQPPAKIIFSAWGIKELGISGDQLKQVKAIQSDHIQEMLRIQKQSAEMLGGNDLRLRFEKRRRMEEALNEAKLKVLTKSQWNRYEKLRGTPYKPFGKLPSRPKPKPDV